MAFECYYAYCSLRIGAVAEFCTLMLSRYSTKQVLQHNWTTGSVCMHSAVVSSKVLTCHSLRTNRIGQSLVHLRRGDYSQQNSSKNFDSSIKTRQHTLDTRYKHTHTHTHTHAHTHTQTTKFFLQINLLLICILARLLKTCVTDMFVMPLHTCLDLPRDSSRAIKPATRRTTSSLGALLGASM